jgi:hypothetical protein
MYVPFKIGRESHLGAWGIDSHVLPQFRKMGLATKLQKANQDSHDVFMSLIMAPVIRAIKKKIGGIDGPEASLYVYTERLDTERLFEASKMRLKKNLGSLGGTLWSSLLVTGFLQLVSNWYGYRLRRLHRPKEVSSSIALEFKPVEGRFGPEADEMWDRARRRFDFAVERSSTYLNWKFVDQPFISYQRFLTYEKGRPVGVVIFRLGSPPEPPVGIIAEIYSINSSLDISRAQIAFALERLRHQGAIGVFCANSLPEYQTALLDLGFLRVSKHSMVIFDRKGYINALKQPCSALLTLGEQDWDEFPRVSHLTFSEVLRILEKGHD